MWNIVDLPDGVRRLGQPHLVTLPKLGERFDYCIRPGIAVDDILTEVHREEVWKDTTCNRLLGVFHPRSIT